MEKQLAFTRLLNEHMGAATTAMLRALHIQPEHPQAPITNAFSMELVVFLLLLVYFIVVRVSLDVEKPGGGAGIWRR